MADEEDDQEIDESKDNVLRRRAEEQTAFRALRFTRDKDSQFSIDMGDGKEVKDRRPLPPGKATAASATPQAAEVARSATSPSITSSEVDRTGSAPSSSQGRQPSPILTSPGANSSVPVQSRAGDSIPAAPASSQSLPNSQTQAGSEQSPQSPQVKPVKLTIYLQARLQLQTETYGVTVRPEGSLLEYIRNVNGRELSLFTQPATDKGLQEAEESLKKIVADTQNMLSAKFGVTFSSTDEIVATTADARGKGSSTVFGRQPNLIELDATGEALAVSDPAHQTADRTAIKISFVEGDQKGGPPVTFVRHPHGLFEIIIFPDAVLIGHKTAHQVSRFFVEALAHNTIYKTGHAQTQSIPDLAQAIASFRSGAAERKQLLKENRSLYEKAKEIDQWEINREYGLQQDGMETKIRLPNGRLVHNKREMREEVQRFEESG